MSGVVACLTNAFNGGVEHIVGVMERNYPHQNSTNPQVSCDLYHRIGVYNKKTDFLTVPDYTLVFTISLYAIAFFSFPEFLAANSLYYAGFSIIACLIGRAVILKTINPQAVLTNDEKQAGYRIPPPIQWRENAISVLGFSLWKNPLKILLPDNSLYEIPPAHREGHSRHIWPERWQFEI